jgi:hypothetical protein
MPKELEEKMGSSEKEVRRAIRQLGKIYQHDSTDPTKHMKVSTKKGNEGFMADSELKPHRKSNMASGVMRSGGKS